MEVYFETLQKVAYFSPSIFQVGESEVFFLRFSNVKQQTTFVSISVALIWIVSQSTDDRICVKQIV